MPQYKNLKKTTGCKGAPGTGIEVLAIVQSSIDGTHENIFAVEPGMVKVHVDYLKVLMPELK